MRSPLLEIGIAGHSAGKVPFAVKASKIGDVCKIVSTGEFSGEFESQKFVGPLQPLVILEHLRDSCGDACFWHEVLLRENGSRKDTVQRRLQTVKSIKQDYCGC